MSRRTFDRRFRTLTGSAPLQWLITQRVLQAQRLLETSDLSVDDVARRCGFRSPVALRGHFRRQLGVSPAAYRTAYRARRPAAPVPGQGQPGASLGLPQGAGQQPVGVQHGGGQHGGSQHGGGQAGAGQPGAAQHAGPAHYGVQYGTQYGAQAGSPAGTPAAGPYAGPVAPGGGAGMASASARPRVRPLVPPQGGPVPSGGRPLRPAGRTGQPVERAPEHAAVADEYGSDQPSARGQRLGHRPERPERPERSERSERSEHDPAAAGTVPAQPGAAEAGSVEAAVDGRRERAR